jgi:hypothetical protein
VPDETPRYITAAAERAAYRAMTERREGRVVPISSVDLPRTGPLRDTILSEYCEDGSAVALTQTFEDVSPPARPKFLKLEMRDLKNGRLMGPGMRIKSPIGSLGPAVSKDCQRVGFNRQRRRWRRTLLL